MYLLDTDIVVGFLRNNSEAVNAVKNLREHGIATSAITIHELVDGAFRAKNKERALSAVLSIINSIDVLSFDIECAKISGKLKAETLLAGKYPGEMDILIASAALRNGMKLVTRNKKDYEKISGLLIKEW